MMNWFRGSIPEAIGASRSKKTIFVVVVTSDDQNSNELLTHLEEPNITEFFSNFITISLKNGSVEAQQFGQLYPLVIIPSIYMIGLEGAPLEVIGGLVDPTVLLSRAQKALELHTASQNIPTPPQVQPLVQPQAQPQVQPQVQPQTQPQVQTPEVVDTSSALPDLPNNELECNESVAVTEQTSSENETPLTEPLEKRVEKANELLTALRKKKEEEEREKEKAEERERRERGKQLQQFKQAQQEREQRELAESRQKQKREEKEALEKIRQQIAQDKADRAARYQTAQATEEERRKTAQIAQEQLKQERAAVAAAARSAFTRLQFRLPDGSTRTDQFASDQRLVDVTNYIDREIRPPFKTYSLCTTFPRRQFASADMDKSLSELDLTPSAALLIVPLTSTSNNAALTASASSWMDRLYSTVSWVWNWVTSFIFPPAPALNMPAPSNPPPQQPNNQSGVRQRRNIGNVRRLADASGDDSDDNATWNGNSTQQL